MWVKPMEKGKGRMCATYFDPVILHVKGEKERDSIIINQFIVYIYIESIIPSFQVMLYQSFYNDLVEGRITKSKIALHRKVNISLPELSFYCPFILCLS